MRPLLSALLTAVLAATSCASTPGGSRTEAGTPAASECKAVFCEDSAYSFVARQVAFGPRVPGTEAHRQCADYLAGELARHGADTVLCQRADLVAFNGDRLPAVNIMGRFNAAAPRNVLLLAHWDTRPWADNDTDGRDTPIDGANDGASGVGVLLELARAFGASAPEVGVDILFVDAEDYGAPSGDEDSWCLGTQYWTAHSPYGDGRLPAYGILLDMVGGAGARFHREQVSCYFALSVVDKVWSVAAASGYKERFVDAPGGSVIDDHLYVNRGGIPCIDIIETLNPQTGSFCPTWHTHDDNMKNIDRATLKAVGQTVLNTIYAERN